jgi:hypothetical protein
MLSESQTTKKPPHAPPPPPYTHTHPSPSCAKVRVTRRNLSLSIHKLHKLFPRKTKKLLLFYPKLRQTHKAQLLPQSK